MVADRRVAVALGTALAATLLIASASSAAFSAPELLRETSTVRLQDVVAQGSFVAVGWREGASPGVLYGRISVMGGDEGTFRQRYLIAGLGMGGMSMDICGGTAWAASVAAFPGDDAGDTDVLISSRAISGGVAGQAFVTSPGNDHSVRDPSVACVGKRLLAIAWLDQTPTGTHARLLLRDLAGLGPTATNEIFDLGIALPKTGIDVAATNSTVVVAWSRGDRRNLRLRRFSVAAGADPDVTPHPTVTLASTDAVRPWLAIRGERVAAAYTDDGKVKVRVSDDGGQSFRSPDVLTQKGTVADPSFATSVDVADLRVVVTAMRRLRPGSDRSHLPMRFVSPDFGGHWTPIELGNDGPRMAALQPLQSGGSRIKEAWHDDGPTVDRLRFQREIS